MERMIFTALFVAALMTSAIIVHRVHELSIVIEGLHQQVEAIP